MSRVETCVSTGDDPILDNDLDDTLNDCDGDFEAETPLIKKKSRKVYEFYKTYDSLEIAKQELNEGLFDSVWYLHKKNVTVKGQTLFFHCKKGSRNKGESCPKVVQLIVNESTSRCTMMQSVDEHFHKERKNPHGISAIVQTKIIEFESYGLKPAQMLVQLRRVADQLPTKLQLSNFLQFHRNKSSNVCSNGTQICLQDFIDFYEKNNKIPEDLDKMFVADCFVEAIIENGCLVQIFRIFFSTKRLLSFTKYVS